MTSLKKIYQLFLTGLLVLVFILFYQNLNIYPGKIEYFIIFTLVSVIYLFYNLITFKSFFHLFLSIFICLGFWFKYNLNSIYNFPRNINYYAEGTGNFDFSPYNIDQVLLISTYAILSLLLPNIIFFKKKKLIKKKNNNIKKNEKIFFLITFISICLINYKLFIYVKGGNNESISLIFYYFFAFFYQVAALLMLAYYLDNQSKMYDYIISFSLILLLLLTNLSRNIFILLPFLIFLYLQNQNKIFRINLLIYKKFLKFLVTIGIIISMFFLVNVLRSNNYSNNYGKIDFSVNESSTLFQTFKNRFVGIDALMAVYASNKKSFNLYLESYTNYEKANNISFYERKILNKKNNIIQKKNNFITVPGFIAHLYYTGSILFLTTMCFILSLIFMYLEKKLIKYFDCSNILMVTLFIIVYRLIHYGYNPINSYLIVIALFSCLFFLKIYENFKKF